MTLRITSLRAENLPPEDGKSCDPYVEVKMGDKKFKTEYLEKNHLAPVWQKLETMQFPWDGRSALPTIEFTVWDHDSISADDFLGFVRFQPHPYMLNVEQRLPLSIRNDGDSELLKEYGTLGNLYVTLASDVVVAGAGQPGAGVTPAYQDQSPPRTYGTNQPSPNRGSPPRGQEEARYQQQQAPSRGGGGAGIGEFRECKLRFSTLRGQNLAPVDGSTCDPYVKVNLGSASWQTETVKENCKNPQWKKLGELSFTWDGRGPLPEIEFEVVDSNRVFSDVYIGYAKVQLHAAMFGTEAFVNLTSGGKTKKEVADKFGNLGSLHFVLETDFFNQPQQQNAPTGSQQGLRNRAVTPVSDAQGGNPMYPQSTGNYPNQSGKGGVGQGLQITVECAKDLLHRDIAPGVDGFVVIQGEKADGNVVTFGRTKVVAGTLCPVWNETFNLRIDPTVKEVYFTVFDLDGAGSTDFLGEASLPCDLHISTSGKQDLVLRPRDGNNDDVKVLREFKAKNFGLLTIRWNNVVDAAQATRGADSSWGVAQSRNAARSRGQASPMLDLAVLSVTNLPFNCDPYIRARYGDNEVYENPQQKASNTSMAMWNFKCTFTLDPNRTTHDVRIEVRSDDKLVGFATLSMPADSSKQKTIVLPLQCGGSIAGEVTAIAMVRQPVSGGGGGTLSDLNDSVLSFTVVSAAGLGSEGKMLNPYLIVGVSGPANEIEYTSPPVPGTRPQWYFQLPELQLDPQDVITVTVWDEDSFGFDTCLGQAKIDATRFTRGPTTAELQLEDRDGSGDRARGTLNVEWSLTPKYRRTGATSNPHMLEVTILDGAGLAPSLNPTAIVRIACDDQPANERCTKCVPKSTPRWDETIQLRVDGLRSRLRLSVWDSDSRTAEFLGETYIDLRNPQDGNPCKLPLRPRQDPHFYQQDVALLNRSPSGLGSLTVAVRTFSVREYDDQVRERLRKRGASYTLSLLVSDSAEINEKGSYYVKAISGGEEQQSQIETSSHPRFRKTFEFSLQYDTEMVNLLLIRRTDKGDSVLGDVTFPVSPPEKIGVEPTSAWVTLKPSNSKSNGVESDRPVKLLVRWRTTRKEGTAGNGAGFAGEQARAEESSYRAIQSSPVRPNATAFGSPSRLNASSREEDVLRNELHALREEVAQLRGKSPRRVGSSSGGSYVLNVYCPQFNRISKFHGDGGSTVADVIASVGREFGFRQPDLYALVYRGNALPVTRYAQDQVPAGETAFLVPRSSIDSGNPNDRSRQNYAYGDDSNASYAAPPRMAAPRSPSQGSPVPTSQLRSGSTSFQYTANPKNAIIERIRSYGTSTALTTAAITLPFAVHTPAANSLIQLCVSRQLNGFARALFQGTTCELLLQGQPLKIADALQDISAQVPTAIIEEVHGYIPILGLGFRIASDPSEGERMFELCALPFQNDGQQQSWFYHAGDDSSTGRATRGIRYIDERGSGDD
jgi:hypothetical protein